MAAMSSESDMSSSEKLEEFGLTEALEGITLEGITLEGLTLEGLTLEKELRLTGKLETLLTVVIFGSDSMSIHVGFFVTGVVTARDLSKGSQSVSFFVPLATNFSVTVTKTCM